MLNLCSIDRQNAVQDYLTTLCALNGIIYLIFSMMMLIFGSKVCLVVMTKKSMSSEAVFIKEHNAFKSIESRIVLLTTMLIAIFFVRAVYNLLYSWGLLNDVFSLSYYWMTTESLVGSFC